MISSTLDERLRKELAELVRRGKEILAHVQRLDSSLKGEELAEVTSWVSRLGNLLRRLYPSDNQHFETYSSALSTKQFYMLHSRWNAHFAQMLGVAQSVEHDINEGLLEDFRRLVQADLFVDFLEMSEHLLQEGYKDAAAVLAGSVLENTLRKVAEQNSVPTVSKSGKPLTIEPLNIALAKQGAYSKLVQKQVTSWAHVRNKAAHGEFGEYSSEEVKLMLLFVQSFAAQQFG